MLGQIFDRGVFHLAYFFISHYNFGFEGGRGWVGGWGEPCIQYVSKSISIYIYMCVCVCVYKYTEWVRQPSKKYFVCIT